MQSNEIGLRSQELTSQIAQQREQQLDQQGQEWMQGLPAITHEFVAGRAAQQQYQQSADKHQQDMMLGDSKLANDQLQRQQAAEELQWTQQLHQTDMLGYQKEVAKAQASLAIAQAQKAQNDLTGITHDPHAFTPDMLAGLWEIGLNRDPATGKMGPATPEQQKAGKEYAAGKHDWHAQVEAQRDKTQLEIAQQRNVAITGAAQTRANATVTAAQQRAGAGSAQSESANTHRLQIETAQLKAIMDDPKSYPPEEVEAAKKRWVQLRQIVSDLNDQFAQKKGIKTGGDVFMEAAERAKDTLRKLMTPPAPTEVPK